ncbi:MAG TPA: family 10 glycosylhydrolase [Chloroflexaceae bacterium]|nr:family 10 glycosylhydrolase [Chloroflexaceae bacterium]
MRATRLALLALALVVVAAALPARPAAAQEPAQQLRAFWVDSLNPGFYNHPQVDELVENVVRAGANTIIVQVRRHGDAWYNQSFEPRAADPRLAPAAEFDPLAYLIEKAHSMGVRVHAWLVVSVTCRPGDRLWGHPAHVCTAHGPRAQGAERWTTATFEGQQVGDFDYGHPASIQYLEGVLDNLLRAYPALDGVHWDYIRFGGRNYGYNQVSLERFNRAHGRPLDSRPRPEDPAWSQWRRDRVTELARRLYLRAKAVKPGIEVSAATITWGGLGSDGNWAASAAYERVFQDWPAWLEEGILDFAVPMHYFEEGDPRSRGWYDGWLAFDRGRAGRRAIVAGVGSWLNAPEQNVWQAQRALAPDEQGRALAGVAFFSYANPIRGVSRETRRAFMDQLRATVFAQPARAPDWPWIVAPTGGHLQGIAAVDGQVALDARVTLFHNGVWLRDLHASADGWFGAVELPPGAYTIAITRADGRQAWLSAPVRPGLVTSL